MTVALTRMEQMTDVINRLRYTYNQSLANRPVTASDYVFGSSAWSVFRLLTGSSLVLSDTAKAYDFTLQVSGKAIRLLEGVDYSDKWGNFFDASLGNDIAFGLWADLAQETVNNLHAANGLVSKWNVGSFLTMVSSDVYEKAKPSNTTLGIVAVILVALVAIMVLK